MQEYRRLVLSLYDDQLRLKEPKKGENQISWADAVDKEIGAQLAQLIKMQINQLYC